MSKEADRGELAAALGVPISDREARQAAEMEAGEPYTITPPPRSPQVGDLIAFPTEYGFYTGPMEIVGIRSNIISVLTHEATNEVTDNTLVVHEVNGWTLRYLHTDSADETTSFESDYGNTWVFSDEPFVRFATDLERQVIAAKMLKQVNDSSPWMKESGKNAPDCRSCGEWPCRRNESCPDYKRLSEGRSWLPEEKRFSSLEEMASRITCGKPAVKESAPTIAQQIELTLEKKRAA